MLRDFKTLRVAEDRSILRVQLNRPEHGNAISDDLLRELLQVLTALEDDRDIRVMVLSGAGEHFCKGGDRSTFSTLLAEEPSGAALREYATRAHRVCTALSQLQVVTIAQLHGDVIGAGLGLAVFCDLRIGADDCRFRMPETALGVPPAWGGVLPRLVEEAGQAWVRRLLITAEAFDAVQAQQLSLLHEVVPSAKLEDTVTTWLKPILRRDPTAMRITKAMLNGRAQAAQLSAGTHLDAELLTAAVARREHRRSM